VPKDVARAIALYKQAAAGGDKYAVDALRELGGTMPGAPPAMAAPQPMD
jgi:hypothetical protein